MASKKSNVRIASIGANRGTTRYWANGKWVNDAGFKVGKSIHVEFGKGRVDITLSAKGERTVSGKGEMPIIDLNTAKLGESVGPVGTPINVTVERGHITLTAKK